MKFNLKLLFIILSSYIYTQEEYLATIQATSYSEWVYYSFETHSVVSIQNPENSLDWDLAFQRKHIKTNSGLSGIGNGGALVDSIGNSESEAYTWINEWETLNEVPTQSTWMTDTLHTDFYDILTHTFVEGIKNPALNSWGWFDETYVLNPTNYVMFVKAANGTDIIKFWAYDYYDGTGGNISFRYQTGLTHINTCTGIAGDINNDDIINVVDVVGLVNAILINDFYEDSCLYDLNEDEIINVVDIVSLVNFILNN
tara:strand:+ start:140 stop:907 length:768 start_codon:yes stop_codon:yes gene_type:complete